ncbi:MAG: D-2-hydroxyacid dehydrogenase family protein [Chloroflexi bacterium]|nr:D-2-hydroxyacid dehydrogenase family protein [Chloroflexota bacterium]
MLRIAILDDYQQIALKMADWGALAAEAKVDAFPDHLFDEAAVAARLSDYDVVIGMRERTPMPRSLLERLPNLKLLITAGARNAVFDLEAATELGIVCSGTSMGLGPVAAELTWGLILALIRHIPQEDASVRAGTWQNTVGEGLTDKTLGVIGLGRLGTAVAKVGLAFDMKVLAWSQNLTTERAAEVGATYATKDELLASSDFVSLHYVLSERSQGMIGARELALMKPSAYLINTSRGPIVDEAALIDTLQRRSIAGAGLDVFDVEPLPADHPFRRFENTVVTPHLGYVTEDAYRAIYGQSIENTQTFLAGDPVRVLNPKVLGGPNRMKG